jgi:hypothetical protein
LHTGLFHQNFTNLFTPHQSGQDSSLSQRLLRSRERILCYHPSSHRLQQWREARSSSRKSNLRASPSIFSRPYRDDDLQTGLVLRGHLHYARRFFLNSFFLAQLLFDCLVLKKQKSYMLDRVGHTGLFYSKVRWR